MKQLTTLILAFAVSVVSYAQSSWKADPNHSKITFSVTHLGISDVLGLFREFDVTVNSSKEDFSDAVFDMTIQTGSINTEVEKRDAHLKSPDFFDAAKNTAMTFKSTSIKKAGNNKY